MSEKSLGERVPMCYGKKCLVLMTILILLLPCAILNPVSIADPQRKNYKIGVIAPWGIEGTTEEEWGYDYLDYEIDLFGQLVGPEINDYLVTLTNPKFDPDTVEFVVTSAFDSTDGYFLEALTQLHEEEGIDIIIGGYFSSQAAVALDYINEHNILLLSPSSTDPSLAINKDMLYRLVPTDLGQGKAIASMLNERGITKLIVIYSDNSWAAGVIGALDEAYDGDMTSLVPYPPELDDSYTVENPDYVPYLDDASDMLTSADGEGVLLLSYRAEIVLQQAASDEDLMGVEWFGADATALNSFIRDEAGEEAATVKLYSSIAGIDAETKSTNRFIAMSESYSDYFDDVFGYYAACDVDAGWLLTLSILKVQEMGKPVNGVEVAKVLPKVASKYYGYSGLCTLDKAGDRVPACYDIWGYVWDGEYGDYHLFGSYDSSGLSWYG